MEKQILDAIIKTYRDVSDVVRDEDTISIKTIGDLIIIVADNVEYWEGEVLELFGIVRRELQTNQLECEILNFGRTAERSRIYVMIQVLQK